MSYLQKSWKGKVNFYNCSLLEFWFVFFFKPDACFFFAFVFCFLFFGVGACFLQKLRSLLHATNFVLFSRNHEENQLVTSANSHTISSFHMRDLPKYSSSSTFHKLSECAFISKLTRYVFSWNQKLQFDQRLSTDLWWWLTLFFLFLREVYTLLLANCLISSRNCWRFIFSFSSDISIFIIYHDISQFVPEL